MSPKTTRMIAVTLFQNSGGISMRAVDALRMIEKRYTDAANDAITITERLLSGDVEVVPSITGSTGNTQGASMVRIPDRKLSNISGIKNRELRL